ncbi:MAG: suppressor of fused domain protein [Actinobacteria bacterium]|nr:suppressor of fused domain protein [Actinomycetota bacterium]
MSNDSVLAVLEDALIAHFGHRPLRASVSFLGVEPIEVLRFEPVPDERTYVTLGMARRPMTGADALAVEQDGPRAELMLQVTDPTDAYSDIWRRVAILGAAPAVEGIVYVSGMTVDLGEPLVVGTACSGVITGESAVAPVSTPEGEVSVLEIVPATSTELAWARVRGSAALRERWREAGTDLRALDRAPVTLG